MLLPGAGLAASDFALVGATLHDGLGGVIDDGVIVVKDGKIARVGKRAEVSVPEGLRTIDSRGQHVAPGLVDLYSRLFISESDLRDFGGAESRTVLDAFDPFDMEWPAARAAGTTTVAIAPGTSQGAGGLGAVIKLKGERAEVVARESHYIAALGVSGDRSTSAERLEQFYRLRGFFNAAKEHRKPWDAYWKAVEKHNEEARKRLESDKKAEATPPPAPGTEAPKPPDRPKPPRPPALDVGREALALAVEGKLPVFIEAHRRDDLEYALLLKKEFGLQLVVLGATQGHVLAGAMKAAGVTVAVEPVLCDRYALEYRDHTEQNAQRLFAAQVPVAICSAGQSGLSARRLRLQATVAVRGGLPREEALRAVTSVPARALGLEGRIGSLAAGKDADLVVYSGEPLDATSRVLLVCVEGELRSIEGSAQRIMAAARAVESSGVAPGGKAGSAPPTESLPEATSPILAWKGAHILTAVRGEAREFERGVIVSRGGRIEVVGGEETPIPEGARVNDVGGRWILPGFMDAHSHAGIGGETDDISSAISEDLRVIEAFDPWDRELPRLIAAGVTSVALAPGGANVIGGRISVLKPAPGRSRLRILRDPAGIKASLAPALSLPRYPTALSGAAAALESWVRSEPFKRQGVCGPIVVEVPTRSTCDRALEILAGTGALVAAYDGGRIGGDAWLRGTPPRFAIVGPLGLGDSSSRLCAAAALRRAGARIAFSSGGSRRDLLTSAVLAIEAGLSRDDALLALTSWPAELYGVDVRSGAAGRIGSLEPGADADIVVWSGDPFTMTARVESVWVDGEALHDAARAPTLAGGGDGQSF